MAVTRVGPEYVRERQTKEDLLLVCAYDDERKFQENHLDGAISLDSFRKRLDTIAKDQEIVFYCA